MEKYYHIIIKIFDDENETTQHFIRKYSQQEYDELYREDDDSCPDWETVFQSSIMINKNGDMDIDEEIIKEDEFKYLYNLNGWTWVN